MENLYADIAARTGGNIYIGVVGPVRTGKSTLIKRIMEQLVIPNIADPYRAERARDELPQSGSGKTIMTSEPKFVPEEAVEITPGGSATLRVRMIDSVGYMVDSAVGAEEDGQPRMVTTPWYEYEIPMTQAAELGTQKVMQEHCSIGIVVTTDGTITDIPRADYIAAENRAIEDMLSTGKPFLTIVNTRDPSSDAAKAVAQHIADSYGIVPFIADCQAMDSDDISDMLSALLHAFPMQELRVFLPRWMDGLEWTHPIKAQLQDTLLKLTQQINTLGQAASILSKLKELDSVSDFAIKNMDLSNGAVSCTLSFLEELFYEILSQKAGIPIESNAHLMQLLCELTEVKKEYDKISDALAAARTTGYGIVMPTAEEMTLETPEIVKKSGAFGVKMKAGAPSIHMIRVDIDTEISPMVGDEKQSQELVAYLCGEDPDKLWESNIFGKSVYNLIQEGLSAKVVRTPADVREKFRGTLGRIVNEGATGLICLIL